MVHSKEKRKLSRASLLIILHVTSAGFLLGQQDCYWPCFHGPGRSNKSSESGLAGSWPEGGPGLVWEISGIGKGYSSVAIAGGRLYTAGVAEEKTWVFAFDLEGALVWKMPNGNSWTTERPWARSYNGSRSTPTYSDGIIYHLGDLGRLAAFDAGSGKELWHRNLREEFNAPIPEYGYAESVLVIGDRLYCCPAGEKAFVACFDKLSGKQIWTCDGIPGAAGSGSLVAFEFDGQRQLTSMSSSHLFGVSMKSGNLLWKIAFGNERENNIADPVYHDGHIFASSGYGAGSLLIRMEKEGENVVPKEVWRSELMDNHHGGVLYHEGYLYGAGHNNRGWYCLDFDTGEQMWKSGGKGSLTYADGMLYLLEERGIMRLVGATPEGYDENSQFRVPEGDEGMHWAHPVVCGGRLYVRHGDRLFVYNIAGTDPR